MLYPGWGGFIAGCLASYVDPEAYKWFWLGGGLTGVFP